MNNIETPDPREEKLPAWIQKTLAQLRMRLAEARKAAQEVRNLAPGEAGEATVVADPHSDFPIRLPADGAVRFTIADGQRIEVQLMGPTRARPARLVIQAPDGWLQVLPQSSNVVEIRSEFRF